MCANLLPVSLVETAYNLVHREGVPYLCVFLCEVRHCVRWFMVSFVLIGV